MIPKTVTKHPFLTQLRDFLDPEIKTLKRAAHTVYKVIQLPPPGVKYIIISNKIDKIDKIDKIIGES